MDRELLLLGLLRMNEMHGYQINELIDAHLGTSIELKKPTVYKLLGKMLENGWISAREEQEGSYPTRRVYAITPLGEEAFQRLLRESLASYHPSSFLSSVALIYLDALPPEEALTLVQRRRSEVTILFGTLQADEYHQGGFQRLMSLQIKHLQAELDWLDELIKHLEAG